MSQVVYQEAFDPYHTIFRLLRINSAVIADGIVSFDTIRILDFYLLFPNRLLNFSFKSEHRRFRKIIKDLDIQKPYGYLPDAHGLFARMEAIQRAAVVTLNVNGFLETGDNLTDNILFNNEAVPKNIQIRINHLNEIESQIISILSSFVNDYELMGKDGIKKRSGLLEYRYDNI